MRTLARSLTTCDVNVISGLYEEGGPPTEVADLLGASFPYPMQGELGARSVLHFADLDK